MRAKEFVINIPLTININSEGELSVDQETTTNDDTPTDAENSVMVPPLQQDLEIKKANAGKESQIISDLIKSEDEH